MIEIRKGQAPAPLERAPFSVRFRASFDDPATPLSGVADVWLCAQRRHLPGRDFQVVPPAGAGA